MATLGDKAVVVTGSGRGIGAGIAKLAAAEGARVVVTDIDTREARAVAAEIVQAGGRAVAHVADISNWTGARTLIECCTDTYGRIDGLVNNAAIFRMARIDEMAEADVRATVEANILGVAFTGRHAAPHMVRQKSGAIVNVTSGAHFGMVGMGAYGASKGAVASFTYTWSLELKEFGVRVNALSPFASTRMDEEGDKFREAHGIAARTFKHPPPEANAPVAIYLLSDQAKAVTGQVVRVQGRELSLVSHPGVVMPVLEREQGWDVAAVADAFARELGKRQLPLGVAPLDVRPAERVTKAWT